MIKESKIMVFKKQQLSKHLMLLISPLSLLVFKHFVGVKGLGFTTTLFPFQTSRKPLFYHLPIVIFLYKPMICFKYTTMQSFWCCLILLWMSGATIHALYAGFYLLILSRNNAVKMSPMEQQRRLRSNSWYYQLHFYIFIVYKTDTPAFIANKHLTENIRIYI